MYQATYKATVRNRTTNAGVAIFALSFLSACGGGSNGPDRVEQDANAQVRAAAFANYTRPDTHGTVTQPDLLVPMRDGFQLTCDLHRPADASGQPAAGKFPSLLINFNSYGRTSTTSGNDLRSFSRKGYAVLWCNTRGSQGIGGASPSRPESVTQVVPFSPQEGQDNYDVIEWIAAQPWSTGNVGQIGTSYGGIMSLRAAGLAPPHLKTVIPVLATHDIYRYWIRPGGTRVAETGDARGFWLDQCSNLTGEQSCSSRVGAEWNSHPTFDVFWAERAVDLNAIKIPTLFVSGVNDFWMQAHDKRFAIMGQRDNVATVIGTWAHNSVESFNPEMRNMYLAWFDRWVAEIGAVPAPPKAVVQGLQAAGTAQWDGFASWPPLSSDHQVLYLTSSGLQKNSPGTGNLRFEIAADGSSAGLALRTDPFSKATTLAGPVEVSLPLSFTATDANIIVNIESQAADGQTQKLGYATYLKASFLESDSSPSARVPNRMYQFNMSVPSKYWTFKTGDRMVLTINSSDNIAVSDSPSGSVTVSLGDDALVRAPMIDR